MNKISKRTIAAIAAAVFLASSIAFGAEYMKERQGMEDYEEMEQLVELPASQPESTPTLPPEETAPEKPMDPYAVSLAGLDLSKLQAENEDIIAWIFIPDTRISYPVVQGSNNDYYLNHTWKHNQSAIGSIFLECQNRPDFTEYNTIVYGHNLVTNPAMFTGLRQYEDPEFWKEHPSVYILNQEGIYRYNIFAAYNTGVRTIVYGLSITKDSIKEKVIQHAMENTVIDTGIVPEISQNILTLSTCTDTNAVDTRWVVQAVQQEFTPLSEFEK